MKIRVKFILLFLINLFLLLNLVYFGFALVNSFSLDLIDFFIEDHTLNEKISNFIIKYHTLIILTLVIFSYGWILSNPLFHILEWINYLSQDKYEEPMGKNGLSRSVSPRTKNVKYTFVLYKNILNQLQYLTNSLKESKRKDKEIEKKKREWVADIAHDLKTPLSYIKGYSSMLLSSDKWTEEDRILFLKKIEEKTEYMETLLQDLNDTFKFEYQSEDIVKQEQDIIAFVKKIVIEFANNPSATDYKIELFNEMDEEEFYYSFSAPLLQRVLNNLLGNAIVHNPKETNISVVIKVESNILMVIVKDDGVGIQEDIRNHIFDRYYKGNSVAKKGSGLGLHISNQFIEAHGGNIKLENNVETGTSLRICLPL
ncbi:sensor histidine kinase [Priestia megaterium]|uniref:sensor histidine kinase n=1 Tax=Priestia megaterium TaxID=1404 RepID=UPI0020798B1E|nr:HAMP domain-containing sensor histidine kinase [Priestia megaterium]MDF2011307.1 HAMP domain-containing sensor histidine kinase [Priestia megaterium]USL39854.1 HAMP domain-containing histidine kinase [Priestia megaterium]